MTKEREGRGSDCNCKCDCKCKSKCKRSGEGSRDTGRCGGGGYGRMGPKDEKDRVVCTLCRSIDVWDGMNWDSAIEMVGLSCT